MHYQKLSELILLPKIFYKDTNTTLPKDRLQTMGDNFFQT